MNQWQEHTGETCPINEDSYIIYRTETEGNDYLSHVHLPVRAGDINWRRTDGGRTHPAPKVGMIARYRVIERPRGF